MFTRLLLSLTLLATLAWQSAAAADVSAQLDRTRISEGETVTLSINVPGDANGEPDLAPLAKSFDILDRSQSSHTSIINGHVDSRRVWQLVLSPKSGGKLQIPALQVGSARTRPLDLEVLPAGSKPVGGDSPKLFVEVDATPHTPYVQQQVVYTIRIFSRLPLRQAGLTEPQVEGAVLEQLGEDRSYQAQKGGQRYNVIERRYALYPQRSGQLSISGPVLSASVPVENQRRRGLTDRFFGRDPFDHFPDMGSLFQETRTVRVRGKNLELDVKSQPAGFSGPWLPAQSLSLQQSWSPQTAEFRVGEPVTRTLTIRARGLAPSQLPDLETPAVPGLKVYPDQPQSHSEEVNGGIEAVKEIKAALVPSRAGKFELPEIRLAWWDTLAGRKRTEVIPARSIEVLPAAAGSAAAAPPPVTSAPQPTAQSEGEVAAPASAPVPPSAVSAGYWPWVAAALGAAWLLTLALLLRERRRSSAGRVQPKPQQATASLSPAAVEHACRANDPQAARQALLAWAAARWPEQPPRGLDGLARRLGHRQAASVLQTLDQALYAPGNSNWDGPAAWRILSPALSDGVRKKRPKDAAPLPQLYPEQG